MASQHPMPDNHSDRSNEIETFPKSIILNDFFRKTTSDLFIFIINEKELKESIHFDDIDVHQLSDLIISRRKKTKSK